MQGDRRHLEMLAVEANYFKARSSQKLATLAIKKDKKVAQIIKISSKWVPKSMKNRGCVADAFLEGLWGGFGWKLVLHSLLLGSLLVTIFH